MKSLTFSPQGVLNLHDIDIAWSLAIAENQDMPLTIVKTSDMTSFEIKNQDGEFLTIWTGNSLLGENFKVIISWNKDVNNSLYQGKLSWQNNTSNYYIEEVHFPAIKAKVSEDSKFFKPDNCGELASMRYVAQKGKRWFYCSMQWTALFPANKDYGYYFDCKDSEHYIKQYDFFYKENTFIHNSVFYVPLLEENKAQFSMPYSCSMGKFTGSWYEAALLYKSWATNQSWYLNRLPVKEKLYNTAMWVWNRGTSNEVIPPVQKLRSDAKVPVALDWYWWHNNPYDTDYPEFWPPRAGEEEFKKNIDLLNKEDIFVQVYTNGMTWDIDTATYETCHGIGSLQVNRDNTPTAMMFNPYTKHRLAIMCGEAKEYHQKMISLADKLANCQLPGLYLDMIGSYAFAPCRNSLHQHTKGGGTYQKDGYYSYVKKIRENHPCLILSTEYASEMMDLFESFIMLDSSLERCYGTLELEPVPAFIAVYHGPGVTVFGSYAIPDGIPPWDPSWPNEDRWQQEEKWHKLYPYQFFIELARCIIWGIQPCVCNLKLEHSSNLEFANEYNFILTTAKFYYEQREFLADGTMLNFDGFECKNIKVEFMKRGIFTLRKDMNVIEKTQPAVLHSVWENKVGKKALILANYTKEQQAFTYKSANGVKEGTIEGLSYLKIEL